jgi:amino acid transporter
MALLDILIGRKLANSEAEQGKITTVEGLPAIGLDGLSSAAYGPEAALAVLLPLGAAGAVWLTPIMLAILVLLAMLAMSYWQTIKAYPVNGGSYTVASENLGANAGLLAAIALMIDYVLNVAVGISAGIGALTSAIPALHPYTVGLCLGVLALITVANLRGTREAGLLFAVPTYLFVAGLLGVIGLGLWRALLAGGTPAPVTPPPPIAAGGVAVTLWLLMRAFASGCTAMTGVEAVSNGVSAFRAPSVTYAHRTLAAIVLILAMLLAGIAFLAHAYHVGAMDQARAGYQSLLSQLTGAVVGRGAAYFVVIGSVLAVLCLSANTSFVDFPRLCRLVARDGYLPRDLAAPGRRLVNSVGIVWLAVGAGALLVCFDGITDRLIPLFAVGAFLAFTLSQSGMAIHWWRRPRESGRWLKLVINGSGAAATGVSLAVILAAKFLEGAWITVMVIPSVLILLKVIRRYYDRIDQQLLEHAPLTIADERPPIAVIPISNWDQLSERAMRYALRLSPDVIAVHLTRLEGPGAKEQASQLRRIWRDEVAPAVVAAGLPAPRLVQIPSPYRGMNAPLLAFVAQIRKRHPGRAIAVVIPKLAEAHWWDHVLHTGRARQLEAALLSDGGPDLAVVVVPWTLEPPGAP